MFVSLKVKEAFFDRAKVKNALDADLLARLKRWGLYGRKLVSRAPRRRKSASKPGQAPTAWKGLENGVRSLRHALTAYMGNYKVIFGPTGLGGNDPIPNALEFGNQGKVKNRLRRRRKIGSGAIVRIGGGSSGPTCKPIASPVTKQVMHCVFARIRSPEQLARADRMEEQVWGPMEFEQTIAERPFVGPSLEKTAEKFAAVFGGDAETSLMS